MRANKIILHCTLYLYTESSLFIGEKAACILRLKYSEFLDCKVSIRLPILHEDHCLKLFRLTYVCFHICNDLKDCFSPIVHVHIQTCENK